MIRRFARSQHLITGGVGARPGLLSASVLYLVLLLMAVLIGMPFFWMVVSSLKPLHLVFDFSHWLPIPPQWQNYSNAVQQAS